MTSRKSVYEAQGGPELLSEFNDAVVRCADSFGKGVIRWRRLFDSVVLLRNKDLAMVAGTLSSRGGVDKHQARKGLPDIVSKFNHLSGYMPAPDSLQVHMEGLLTFIERGSRFTLVADIVEPPAGQSPRWSVHGIDMLIDRNVYKCIFEVPEGVPRNTNGTFSREFTMRFDTEFRIAVDHAPLLRVLLDHVERSSLMESRDANEAPRLALEFQRLSKLLVAEQELSKSAAETHRKLMD